MYRHVHSRHTVKWNEHSIKNREPLPCTEINLFTSKRIWRLLSDDTMKLDIPSVQQQTWRLWTIILPANTSALTSPWAHAQLSTFDLVYINCRLQTTAQILHSCSYNWIFSGSIRWLHTEKSPLTDDLFINAHFTVTITVNVSVSINKNKA